MKQASKRGSIFFCGRIHKSTFPLLFPPCDNSGKFRDPSLHTPSLALSGIDERTTVGQHEQDLVDRVESLSVTGTSCRTVVTVRELSSKYQVTSVLYCIFTL